MDEAEKKALLDEEHRQVKQARNEEVARIKAKYYHNEDEGSPKGYASERQPGNDQEEEEGEENL